MKQKFSNNKCVFQVYAVGIADDVIQPHWGVWSYLTQEHGDDIECKIGSDSHTSGNRMTMFAINTALLEMPYGSNVCIHTDNKYVQGAYDHCQGKRCFKANLDLISEFYTLVEEKNLFYAIVFDEESKRNDIYVMLKNSIRDEFKRVRGGNEATDMKRFNKDEIYAQSKRKAAQSLREKDPQTNIECEADKYASYSLSLLIDEVELPKKYHDAVRGAITDAYIEGVDLTKIITKK